MHKRQIGDKSYEILVCEHHRRALAYALSLVRSEDDARDLVQDAFVTAYRNLDKFDNSKDFGAWLRGIVRMKYLEFMRQKREQPADEKVLDDLDECHLRWDDAALAGQTPVLEALQHCMDKLHESMRLVVNLFYFDKKGCDVISTLMDVTEETVWKRLERARITLFDCINKRMELGAQ